MAVKKARKKPTVQKSGGNPLVENILSRIRAQLESFGAAARAISDYILANPESILNMSVTELAEATDASEGSIVNFCRQLGVNGYQQLKLSLAQELVKPVQFIHEDLAEDDDTETICKKVFHSGIQALRDSLSVLDARQVRKAVEIIRNADRVEVYGVGSSAPIAEDANYRMLRIGMESKVVVDSHIQAISASRTSSKVAVLTISHSGATHETVTATRLAKEAGAKTIVVTNYSRSPILAYADVKLYTMAAETKFRTEAMTSRIAQLCVVDALIAALALADFERSTQALRRTFDVLSIKRY